MEGPHLVFSCWQRPLVGELIWYLFAGRDLRWGNSPGVFLLAEARVGAGHHKAEIDSSHRTASVQAQGLIPSQPSRRPPMRQVEDAVPPSSAHGDLRP